MRARFALLLLLAITLCGERYPLSAAPAGLVIDGVPVADGATYAAAKSEGKLLLYSTYASTVMTPLVAKFQADTGLSVDVVRLPSQSMFDRVLAEYSARKLGADYVDLTDITLVDQLAQRGIFRPYHVPDFGAIEPVLRDPNGRWYYLIRSITVIGVNTAITKPADVPVRWSDILNSRWKGNIGLASIEAGGTAYGMYFFLRQRYGLDFWKKLAAQNARIEPSSAPDVTDLVRGETAIAVDGISSLRAAAAGGAPIEIVAPAEGVPAFGIIGGITSTAPHPHAAQLWMDWLTSKRGCAAIATGAGYGVLRDQPPPQVAGVTMPPESRIYNIRLADYNRNRTAYISEWHQLFGNR